MDADPTRIGLKGSWTQVYRLFSPSEDRPKTCEYVHDPAELIGKIAARYQQAAPGAAVDADEGYELDGKEPTYHGEFWVFAEREGDGVRSVSLELLGKARRLADSLGEKVGAVLPCDDGRRPAGAADRGRRRHRLRPRAPAPRLVRPPRPQEGDRRPRPGADARR